MATPRKEQIVERAMEMFHQDSFGVTEGINPTLEELNEGGYLARAQHDLVRSDTHYYLDKKEDLDKIQTHEFEINLDELLQSGLFISGTSGSGKSNLGYIIVDVLMQKGVICYCIDSSQQWEKHSSIPNVLRISYPSSVTFRDGHVSCSTVFDVSMLMFQQRIEFADAFCKKLLDMRKRSAYDPPTVVIFEEAQLIFYQGSMRSPKKCESAIELATVGRNFNLRFIAISQFPSMVDKLLIKLCRQRYFAWTSEPNDLSYIEEIIGKEMAKQLPKLEVGEFVYSYPVR